MKARTIGIVAAAGLAALVGGCTAEAHFNSTSNIDRQETLDGYVVTEHGGNNMIFRHNRLLNYDTFYKWPKGEESVAYVDEGCDGTVDAIAAIGSYSRDDQGTEEMFAQADKELAQAKKYLGVQ